MEKIINEITYVWLIHSQNERILNETIYNIRELEKNNVKWLIIFSIERDDVEWNKLKNEFPDKFIFNENIRTMKVLSSIEKIKSEWIMIVDGDDLINVDFHFEFINKNVLNNKNDIILFKKYSITNDLDDKRKIVKSIRTYFGASQIIINKSVYVDFIKNEQFMFEIKKYPLTDVTHILFSLAIARNIKFLDDSFTSPYIYRIGSSASFHIKPTDNLPTDNFNKNKSNIEIDLFKNEKYNPINSWIVPFRQGNGSKPLELFNIAIKNAGKYKWLIKYLTFAHLRDLEYWNSLEFQSLQSKKNVAKIYKEAKISKYYLYPKKITNIRKRRTINLLKKANSIYSEAINVEKTLDKSLDQFVDIEFKNDNYKIEKDDNNIIIKCNIEKYLNGELYKKLSPLWKDYFIYPISSNKTWWYIEVQKLIHKDNLKRLIIKFELNMNEKYLFKIKKINSRKINCIKNFKSKNKFIRKYNMFMHNLYWNKIFKLIKNKKSRGEIIVDLNNALK